MPEIIAGGSKIELDEISYGYDVHPTGQQSLGGKLTPAFALICQYLSSTVRSLALTAAPWMSRMVQNGVINSLKLITLW